MPPLRDRREDIPLLVEAFVHKFSLSMNKRVAGVSAQAMDLLQRYSWPGNVRELENAIERAMVVAQDDIRETDFTLKDVPEQIDARTLDDVERTHIFRVLEECRGNQTRAAEILDIDRVTLHNRLKKYGWKRTPGVPE